MPTDYEVLSIYSNHLCVQKFINHDSKDRIHWHEEIEILYFVKGSGTLSCNLKKYTVRAGDIVVINGKELHTGCVRNNDATYYCFHISTDFFHNLLGKEYVVFKNLITDHVCADLLDKVLEEAQTSTAQSTVKVRKLMYDFFLHMVNTYVYSVYDEADYKKQFSGLDTFNSVIEYIDVHYHEDLSVTLLAKRFFLSTSYLSHLFKRKTGKSIMAYVNEIRIQRAKSLLEKDELSVGTIAETVGFHDINYFCRKFKALSNMTPTEYQKRSQK